MIVSDPTSALGFGLVNGLPPDISTGISIGSPAPSCITIFFTVPSVPGASVICMTILPAAAIIPPSTDVSMMLAAGLFVTSAMRIFIGGSVPIVIV